MVQNHDFKILNRVSENSVRIRETILNRTLNWQGLKGQSSTSSNCSSQSKQGTEGLAVKLGQSHARVLVLEKTHDIFIFNSSNSNEINFGTMKI